MCKNYSRRTEYDLLSHSKSTSQGHYRIIRGKGACGLNTMVTTATEIKKHGNAEKNSIPLLPPSTPGAVTVSEEDAVLPETKEFYV